METKTSLGFLMEALGISGKALAIELGVDTTAVSKWRNNKRKLTYGSEYIKKIAYYFLSDTFIHKRKFLLEVMEKEKPGIAQAPLEEQVKILCRVLSDNTLQIIATKKNQTDDQYETSMQVFSAKKNGWYKANNAFWQFINSKEEKGTIILGNFGDINWKNADVKMIENMKQHVIEAVEKGYKVKIIESIGDAYKSYEVLFRWLSMYINEGVEVYYIEQDIKKQLMRMRVYTYNHEAALVNHCISEQGQEMVFNLYTDPLTAGFYGKWMDEMLTKTRRMIRLIEVKDTVYLGNLLDENLEPGTITYMINPVPTFINMPPKLVREILEDNDVEEEQIEYCILTNKVREKIRMRCNFYQLYDLDQIVKRIEEENYIEFTLSKILKKNIVVTREQFKKQLLHIKEEMQSPKYNVYLSSFKRELEMEPLSLVIQEDNIAIVWDQEQYDHMLYSQEITFVGGFVDYVEEMFDKIPLIKRKKEWTHKKIKSLINKK